MSPWLEIERLKLLLAKAPARAVRPILERGAKLVEQLELQLAELEETVAEEDTAAKLAAPPHGPGACRPGRKPAAGPCPRTCRASDRPNTCRSAAVGAGWARI